MPNVLLSRGMCSNVHLLIVISCLKLIKSKLSLKSCICILRVEVPDGSYTLVLEDVNEGLEETCTMSP
jgi:hypothetical protein